MRGGSSNGSRGLYWMGKVGTWEESRRVKGLEVRELEEEEEGFQRAGRIERAGCWSSAFPTGGGTDLADGLEWSRVGVTITGCNGTW